MCYKSFLVHVEPNEAGRERLRGAVRLARQFKAQLIGLGARALDPMPDPIGLSVVKLREAVEAEIASAERAFREEARALESDAVWRSEFMYPTEAVLRHAASADLIVTGAGVAAHPRETRVGCADIILCAGAPVIAVPDGARLVTQNVLIGWKDTRETRRAVWDALPILKRAESVRLVRFAASGETRARTLDEVASRLRLHGVNAESEVRAREERSVAEDFIASAAQLNVDLIVVGGYGHSRLQEQTLGGVTQGLLQKAKTAVLFSH